MHLTSDDIKNLGRIKRLNLINSVTGIKPANLIGTRSEEGQCNLAIFSSIVHLGSNPALIGFILRPKHEVRRHTYENIVENGFYTINQVSERMIEQAHYTSAKFDKGESEFEHCGFTEEYIDGFSAPFVKESFLKMGMKVVETIPIQVNNTLMVIGEVQHLIFPEQIMDEQGHLSLDKIESAGISGLNTYYSLDRIAHFPYARKEELPEFNELSEDV